MFEAIVTLCIAANGTPCRDQLVAGYEAQTRPECEAALADRPPDLVVEAHHTLQEGPFCRAIGPALTVQEIAPGVFVHMGAVSEPDAQNRGDVSNLGFIVGQTHVAVIDTGSARWMGEGLWRAIRAHSDLPVSHVILTHMHPDHVFGAAAFAGTGAQVVGHANLPRALADREANYAESFERLIGPAQFLGSRAVPVDVTLAADMTIDLGGRALHLQAWPLAHTGTDVTVRDDATGSLFAGDLVFHRHTPALDGSLKGWQNVLNTLQNAPLDRVVPGHGGPVLDWPEGAADLLRYLEVLEADTRAALGAGMRLGDAARTIAQSEAPLWELFQAYNPRNATVAFTELEWE
jgi:quinoprotein relay system zinc metallohydrolase 2